MIAELADLPVEMARAAIAHGQARSDVRDLAGWVVKLLRTARDYHWHIPCATDASSTAERRLSSLDPSNALAHESLAYVDEIEQAGDSAPTGAELDTTADISTRIRTALRARVPRKHWPLIERVTADTDAAATTITLMCERQSDIPMVQSQILPLVRSIVREFGWSHTPHLAIGAPQRVRTASDEATTQRPAWIRTSTWTALPAVLRVALSGASLVDGQVRGATPTLTALLHMRFAAEVQALLEEHGGRAADGL